ncbi:uncharacterized protein OCT59_007448 [Rhizophagus irregularis]|uniref:uncharacterized protein n=1 Tax=Rhizophagus irregularis TaxID=588596 RepID=UPI00331D39D9|nr:hypothetical protein OCT59_007448 [Rhizophagus irregularis]
MTILMQLAYVLVICSTILNPNHDEIRCKKNIMKQKVKKFLVKKNNKNSQRGIRYSDFEDNSYEEEESGNETEDEDDDV